MVKRKTIEEVREIFKEKGFTLISDEYFNNNQSLEFICVCGTKREITLGYFKRGSHLCQECGTYKGNPNKYTIEEVRSIYADRGCTLLSNDYIDNKTNLDFICYCERLGRKILSEFLISSQCKQCGVEQGAEKRRYTFEQVVRLFSSEGCVLLSDIYKNSSTKMNYKCVCGNVAKISLNAFLCGKRCLECKKIAISEKTSGENHHAWNPNLTDEERHLRRSIQGYKEWIKNCFIRDNYTCQCCGQVGGKLNAHHKDGYHWCEERRIDDTNSVTLCERCHLEFHSVYGQKNNTEAQFEEFIKINYKLKIKKKGVNFI